MFLIYPGVVHPPPQEALSSRDLRILFLQYPQHLAQCLVQRVFNKCPLK